jgi:glycosyltransferase involved in cell wall biosynthesis
MARIGMVLIGDIRYDGRVRKEIGTLVAAGHQVELVVSDFTKDKCGGEDLGIPIHYIPTTLWSSPAQNFLEQIWFNYKAASILKTLTLTHIHCHDLSTLLSGVWAKKATKAKLVFDAHELMPESMGGLKEVIWGYIEKKCITSCDAIIMPEKNRIIYFKQKYRDIPEPMLLENFPRKKELPTHTFDLFRKEFPIRQAQRIILYCGSIGEGRYIEELIDSIKWCGNNFALVLLGKSFKDYEKTIYARIAANGVKDRVFLRAPVPHAHILAYMASCDIGIAFYPNTDLNNYYCASNKLYEYFALNKVVLTNNYPGLIEAVESFCQGVCLSDVTPKNLAKAYSYVTDSSTVTPGARKFFWEDNAHILTDFYGQPHFDSPKQIAMTRRPAHTSSGIDVSASENQIR